MQSVRDLAKLPAPKAQSSEVPLKLPVQTSWADETSEQ